MLTRLIRRWPRTVEEAVDRVLLKLKDAEKEEVGQTAEDDLDLLHFGLGATIRNECGLWDGNIDLLASCGSPDMHADSASAVIVRAVWKKSRAGG
jgi:hypothetical protein